MWSIAWPAESASTPGSASGAVISAVVPGAPARDAHGRPAGARRELVAQCEHGQPGGDLLVGAAHRGQAVGERALADDRGDPPARSADLEHVAAGERGAPERDRVSPDAVERAAEAQRRAPVVELAADVEQLARLAAESPKWR